METEEQEDVKPVADSSVATDVNTTEESSTQVAEDVKQEDGSESSNEATGEENQAEDQKDTQQVDEKQDEEKHDEPKVDESKLVYEKPEDKDLPFGKHPRFQEVIAEKNTFKQELETLRPQAQRIAALDGFMQQNGIQGAQLQRALEYLRLVNSDPEKAADLIEQDYKQLATATGRVLPADLQEKVAAGVLDPELAKEIARGRGQKSYQEYRGQATASQQSMQLVQAVDGTIGQWAQMKAQTDPDLKPGTAEWKMLDLAIKDARARNPSMLPQEAMSLVEKLYKEVKDTLAPLAPKKIVTRPKPKEAASAASASQVIKTPEDVTRAVLRGMRPHQLKYS
jgi:hypothetical protein